MIAPMMLNPVKLPSMISANIMNIPIRPMRSYLIAYSTGRSDVTTPEPSRGGIGMRLKKAR